MTEHVVILVLAALPLTGGTSLDRGALVSQAGCQDTGTITIAQDSDRGWVVFVRCRVGIVPTAEILRTDPWDPARRVVSPSVPAIPGG